MQFTTQSQLMTNYVPGTPLSAQGRLRTVYSDTRSPMLFSLDANAQLGLTRPSATDPTGWARVDLNARLAGVPGLGKAPVVHSFAVSQDAEGGVWLVVAAAPKPGAMSQVYVSGRMSNGESTSDWDALADRLTPRKLPSGLKVTDIAVGHSTTPFSVAACLDAEGQVQYHQINPDPAGDWSTLLLPLPQNATRCAAVAVGHHRKLGQGVYSLFDLQTAQSLVFTTLPTMVRNHLAVDTVDLDLPDGIDARTLATMVNGDGSTDLYVGGEGVCRFSAAAQLTSHKPTEVLLDGSHVSGVRELVVATDRQNDGQISLWAIDHRDSLVYTEGSRSAEGSKYRWTPPLLLDTEVAALSAYRVMTETGQARSSAAMAVGGNDGSFRMVTQDPRTALWQQQTVSLQTDDDVFELSTYTTRVAVTDSTGAIAAGQQVLVEPDRDCAALINGRYYALRAGTPKPAVTDQDGVLTIVLETTDLTAPTYTFRTEDTEGVAVDPSAGTKDRMRSLTGPAIAAVVRANGKPLADSKNLDETCEAVAKHVADLMAAHDKLAAHPGPALASTARVTSVGSNVLEVAAGDLLAALRHLAHKVMDFEIRAQAEFVELMVKIGDWTYQCLIDAAHVAISAIDWVLRHTVGLSLEDLLNLLGDVLDWGDILANHRVLTKVVTLSFDRLVEEMAHTKTSVDDWFSRIRENVVDGRLVVDRSADIFAERVGRPAGSPYQSAIDSPSANLAKHHFTTNLSRSKPGAFVPDDLGDVVQGLADSEIEILQQVGHQLEDLFGRDLAGKSVGDFVTALVEIVELAVLDTLENITLTVVDLGIVMVSVIKKIMTTRWNIPVLTALYEKIICRGDGSRLTLLDVCCLLGAIPATIVGKLATDGKNLFSAKQIKAVAQADSWDALMAGLAASAPRAALRAAAPAQDPHVAAAAIMQLTNAILRDVSIVLGGFIDFRPAVGASVPVRWFKLGLDWCGYALGVVGMMQISPKHPTDRQSIDIAMTVLGFVPATTASLQEYLKWTGKDPAVGGIAAKDLARYIDSGYGLLIMILSAISVSLQAKESVSELTPQKQGGLLLLKTVQNFSAGAAAVFSMLLADSFGKDPSGEDAPAKLYAQIARLSLSGLRGAAQTIRAGLQFTDAVIDFEGAIP